MSSPNLKEILHTLEKEHIVKALEECKGIKKHAAVLLGLNRTTLLMKMRRYGLPLLPSRKKEA